MWKNLLCLLLAVAFWGCTTIGQPFNLTAAPNIEIGKTTQGEVVSMLGMPYSKQRLDNGIEVYEYSYGTQYPFGCGASYNYLQVQFYNGVVINKWKRATFIGTG